MRIFLFIALIPLVSVAEWAQPALGGDVAPAENVHGQRRAELRLALKAPRVLVPQGEDQPVENAPQARHLSTEERANLRLQLSQQRREAKPDPR